MLRIEPRVQYVGKPYFTWTGPDESSPLLTPDARQSEQQLFIPRVSTQNAGTYTLTIMDQTGSTSAKFSVIVVTQPATQKPQQTVTRKPNSLTPFNILESQTIELEEGETAMLVCAIKPENVQAREMILKSWSKSIGRFQRNIRPNIERLQILKFNGSNAVEISWVTLVV